VQKKRILIMAGGTGGHVFPALAVANAMKEQHWHIEWLGTRTGMEATLVPNAGFRLHTISITGIRRERFLKRALAPFRLIHAVIQSLVILARFKPQVVLGMGGFAAGPGGVAAWLLRYPLVIHEQNSIAGVTNRLLAYFATQILTGFPHSFSGRLPARLASKIVYTGNPVRAEFLERQDLYQPLSSEEKPTLPEPALQEPTLLSSKSASRLKVLIVGGSQGARAINELCPQVFQTIPIEERPLIWHQTGATHHASTQQRYETLNVVVRVEPFIQNMAAAYQWADLVICRAGALTIAELMAVGVASILIPFPYAVDDHQTYNGHFLESAGAALVISQAVLDPALLADIIMDLSRNRDRISAMAMAAGKLAPSEAVQKVLETCVKACQQC
jgi:UDP-N-acetylglucosamine--N-acetylmuramyl-(pentapeptide) pyrophosphoryl-undecaprenol N-acetylglucosamine transferase